MSNLECPLCRARYWVEYHRDARRNYFQCPDCALVVAAPDSWLDLAAERAEYERHQNRVDDPGYRNFLMRALLPIVERLPPPASGLDFGCGPGPALAAMFRERDYAMSVYDPYFASELSVLNRTYDFVACTEVIEHVHKAKVVWEQLIGLLKPRGLLVLMTKRVTSPAAFATWHYKNDPTHVAFYSESTLRYVAERFHCQVDFPSADVALFTTA